MIFRSTLANTLLCFSLLLTGQLANAQILSYTSATTGALNSVATNATGTALARENGVTTTGTPCGTGFSSTNFTSTTTYSSTLGAIQVTCTPNTGYTLNVTGFSVGLRRSSTGPADVRFAYSTNGGTTWTNQGTNQSPDNAACGTTTTGTWSTSFAVAAPAVLMFRVYGFDASSTSGTFQVLNLTINGTVTGAAACVTPTGLSATSITSTGATLNWGAVSGAVSYNVEYRQTGASTWSTTTATTNSVGVSGLAASTAYQYQVETVCSGSSTSAYSSTGTFTTSATPCTTPTGLSASGISTTGATLNWGAVSGAVSYNIEYRQTGASTWSTTTAATNSVGVSGLTASTAYQYQVQTVCSGSSTSAYSATGTFTTSAAPCTTPSSLSVTAITSSSATLNWGTVSGAASYNVEYRQTGASSWSTTTATTNSVGVSGLTASTAYQYQVQTVCSGSSSSAYSSTSTFTTSATSGGSGSSGKILVYFNHPVDTTVSTGVYAQYLNNCMADTLIAYINRAKYSIDIAQYEYSQTTGYSNIATAVNNAYARGVTVRWIYCAAGTNTGLSALNSGIHTLSSPAAGTISPCSKSYNIMHDKFITIDANSTNPNDALVISGSPDWNSTMFQYDFNNIIILQDSALAHAYTNQFNLMWGSTTATPNSSASLWGPCKSNSGHHIFTIAGKEVELYFSPSDSTNAHILSTIETANTDLYFGVYTFTDAPDATQLVTEYSSDGVTVNGIVDEYSVSYSAYPILNSGLGTTHFKVYNGGSYIYHNKYLIVDPSNTCSNPMVLTGSHNWSVSADGQNDENTLIIHNDTIANLYYQAFKADFNSMSGTLSHISVSGGCGTTYHREMGPAGTPMIGNNENEMIIFPNPTKNNFTIQYNLAASENVSITITNTLGQTVSTVVSNEMQEQGMHEYDFAPVAPGMYFARVSIGGNVHVVKVVKL